MTSALHQEPTGPSGGGRPLIPAPLRSMAFGALGVCAVVFVVLAVRFAGTSAPGRFDRAVDNRLMLHVGGFQLGFAHLRLADVLVNLGNPWLIGMMSLVIASLMFGLRRWRAALLALLAAPVAGVCTEWLFKPLVDRRLFASGFAFPSGHTTGAFSVAFLIALLMLGDQVPRLSRAMRILASAVALVLALGTAVGLVASHYHYTTDTIGGACVALVVVGGLAVVIDAVASRLSVRRPARPLENRSELSR